LIAKGVIDFAAHYPAKAGQTRRSSRNALTIEKAVYISRSPGFNCEYACASIFAFLSTDHYSRWSLCKTIST